MISASRCVETPPRHRRDSRPSDVVGGFLFEPSRATAMTTCETAVEEPWGRRRRVDGVGQR